jgi:hypothetical protein
LEAIKKRLASREDLLRLFAVCVFPVHVWAYVTFFYELPSLLLRNNLSDIIGVLSYILAFAFIESVLLFIAILLMAIVLPSQWIGDRLVAVGIIIVFAAVLCAIPIHRFQFFRVFNISYSVWIFLWTLLALIIIVLVIRVIQRNKSLEDRVTDLGERITILSILFLLIDVLVIIRLIVRLLT